MGDWARIRQRFCKNSNEVRNGEFKSLANTNEMTKRGILTNDNFIKMTSLAKIYKSLAKM